MNSKPLLFRIRRWLGMCDDEFFWMRHFLPTSDHILDELLSAVRRGRITEGTFAVCRDFLQGIPLSCRWEGVLTVAQHFERQQEITDALLAFLEN